MYSVDTKFNKNERPRRKLQQVGGKGSSIYTRRPALSHLRDYEGASIYDTTIRASIKILLDTLIDSLGDIAHIDPDIDKYLKHCVERQQDVYGIDYKAQLKQAIKTAIWSGFSVSESIFDIEDGTLFLKECINYHPTTIYIRPDKNGRLNEGQPTYDGYLSGIYQLSPMDVEEPIPLWKLSLLTNESEYNNYYGRSALESAYRWHVLKEAILDMMVMSLERHGTPIVAITMPKTGSTSIEVDPETGEERTLTSQEVIQQQMESNNLGQGNVLILPQVDPAMKPEIKVLSSSNNLGRMFLDAADYCDIQITKSLLVPNGLLDSLNKLETAERQIEMFNRILGTLHTLFVKPYIAQTYGRLVKLSYNRPSALKAPVLPLQSTIRPEQRVALMQMIKGLGEQGWINPLSPEDWKHVRELVGARPREQDNEDIDYIISQLVTPKQPNSVVNKDNKDNENNEDNKEDNKESKIKQTRAKIDPNRDRSKEGKVKGKGGVGRPTGDATPQQNPRTK